MKKLESLGFSLCNSRAAHDFLRRAGGRPYLFATIFSGEEVTLATGPDGTVWEAEGAINLRNQGFVHLYESAAPPATIH